MCEEGPCTLGHVVSYCRVILENDVFDTPKRRHETVLATFIKNVFLNLGDIQYNCDLHGLHLPFLSSNIRPDLVIINGKQMLICELSCPMEEYNDVRHSEKTSKYQILLNELTTQGLTPSVFAVEVGARGVVSRNTFDLLAALGINSGKSKQIADELTKVALLCSYKFYLNRDN
ncbi:hypothetical protein RCL1_003382 [Eukaryota sp. TZLM3-RCL]